LHALGICDNHNDPLFIEETLAAADDDTEEANTEIAVGGCNGAGFSFD
jgi:hypothetical protein